MSIKDISIGYNTRDFFYTIVGINMPTDEQCNNPTTGYKTIPDEKCIFIDSTGTTGSLWQDMSLNCYNKELCMNKDLALKINSIENKHLGSAQNVVNSQKLYNNEILKSINLVGGIISLIMIIYYVK